MRRTGPKASCPRTFLRARPGSRRNSIASAIPMSDMAGAYDRAAALAARIGFCEAPGESLPVDIAAAAERPDGPLSGWLVGLKSNFRVSGQAWTAGIGARRDRIADRDAEITA